MERIREEVRNSDPPARDVLLDLEMTFELDVPSLDALAELKEALDEEEVGLMLVRVHEDVNQILSDSGVLDKIGTENVHVRVLEAVLDYLALSPETKESVRAALEDAVRNLRADAAKLLERAIDETGGGSASEGDDG
jgi:MFS superfamily sulfate permease-like transporter